MEAAQYLACGRAEPPEAHPDRGHHGIRQVAGQCLVQRLERLRPGARRGAQVHAERDRPQQLDRENRNTRGVGPHSPDDAVDLHLGEAGQHPTGQRLQRDHVERPECDGGAVQIVPQSGAQIIHTLDLSARRDGDGHQQRCRREIPQRRDQRQKGLPIETVGVVYRQHNGLLFRRSPEQLAERSTGP